MTSVKLHILYASYIYIHKEYVNSVKNRDYNWILAMIIQLGRYIKFIELLSENV